MRVQGPDLGMRTSPLKTTPLRLRHPQRRHPQNLRLQSLRLQNRHLPRQSLRLQTPDTPLSFLTPSNGGHLAVSAIGMSGDCPC